MPIFQMNQTWWFFYFTMTKIKKASHILSIFSFEKIGFSSVKILHIKHTLISIEQIKLASGY